MDPITIPALKQPLMPPLMTDQPQLRDMIQSQPIQSGPVALQNREQLPMQQRILFLQQDAAQRQQFETQQREQHRQALLQDEARIAARPKFGDLSFGGKVGRVFSTIGNIAGDAIAPGLMALTPGTQLHGQVEHQRLIGQVEQDNKDAQSEQAAQDESALRQAQTGEANARAQAITNPPEKADDWEHVATDQGLFRYNKSTGALEPLTYQGKPLNPFEKPNKDESPSIQIQRDLLDAENKSDKARIAADQQKLKDMNPAAEQRFAFQVGEAGRRDDRADSKPVKPTADEQRRADLTDNLNENLSQLEDILNRRPELFGPIAGRWTEAKNAFGTSDPDIAALETIKHQMGIAQISAHGMRSAHGIEAAAQSLVNGFHNSPEAMKAAINAARNSVSTFTHDANNPTEPRGQGKGPSVGTVEDGHRFKGGDPSDPKNWEKVK